MPHIKKLNDNLYCLRELTAKKISQMNTYNFQGFVGNVVKRGDMYIVSEITEKPQIVGQGSTVEEALISFEKAVRRVLRETAKDSQKKMLIRRFAKAERIHSRINSINHKQLQRKIDRAARRLAR